MNDSMNYEAVFIPDNVSKEEFLINLGRRRKELNLNVSGNSQDIQIREMISFIEKKYSFGIGVEDIADAAGVSRTTCCRLFRKVLHMSPIEFLNARRLRAACRCLQETQLSILDIAIGCGFNNVSYFTRIFVKHYGCTPRNYRLQNASSAPGENRPIGPDLSAS